MFRLTNTIKLLVKLPVLKNEFPLTNTIKIFVIIVLNGDSDACVFHL